MEMTHTEANKPIAGIAVPEPVQTVVRLKFPEHRDPHHRWAM